MKLCALSIILGIVLCFGMPSRGFPENRSNPVPVGYVLLESLKSLKESVLAVERQNEALRLQNDFFLRKITMMTDDLAREQSAPATEDPQLSLGLKEARVLEQTLARRMEEYRSLRDESTALQQRIKAKEESLANLQARVTAVREEMNVFRNQISAISDASGEDFQRQVGNLENVLQESRNDLLQQRRQKGLFQLKPDTVKTVAGAEFANRQLWSRMAKLETDLRESSEKMVQNQQDISAEGRNHQEQIAALEEETRMLNEQIKRVEQELKDLALPPTAGAADDRTLTSYRQHLQEDNQRLREQAVSLRDLLP